jgi:hypothetical protein
MRLSLFSNREHMSRHSSITTLLLKESDSLVKLPTHFHEFNF